MQAIWKYQLSLSRNNVIEMPRGAVALHVHEQGGKVCLWAEVDPDAPKEYRGFDVVGTGWGFTVSDRLLRYIGTAHCGAFVWHVFEFAIEADHAETT